MSDGAVRVAIVSGGTGTIGAAICRALSAQGHHVVVGYRSDPGRAAEVAGSCVAASPVHLDVTDETSVAACLEAAMAIGTVTVVVNNAGLSEDGLMLSLDSDRFDRVIDTNLRGAFLLTRAALRPMLRARHGRVIHVSSIVALRGNVGQTAYGAAKAGLIGMARSLAREVARKGITVNAVAPGFVESAMTHDLPEAARTALAEAAPIGRAVTAEEVAQAISYLASPGAAATTGVVLPIDGGAAI